MSQDSTKPPGYDIDAKFQPVQAGDVSDLDLLPRRFDQFAAEVRTSFELLTERIMPALDRIHNVLDDIGVRLARLERGHDDLKTRVNALEQSAQRRRKAKK